MDQKTTPRLSRNERALIAASLVMMFLCASLLLNQQLLSFLTGRNSDGTLGSVIAQVESPNNDIRLKKYSSFAWSKATQDPNVRGGDSLFVGAGSSTHVSFEGGSRMRVDENSLIRFNRDNGQMNLGFGRFLAKVQGKINVTIQGQTYSLDGNGADLEIDLRDNLNPRLRTLSGQVTITNAKGHKQVVNGQMAQLQVTAKAVLMPAPYVYPSLEKVHHTWSLYDHYESVADELRPRDSAARAVSAPVWLKWRDSGKGPYFVELSKTDSFALAKQQVRSEGQEFLLSPNHLGRTWWRVSRDGKTWSSSESFEITAAFTGQGPQPLQTRQEVPSIDETPVQLILQWQTQERAEAYVIEISDNKDFPSDRTRAFWRKVPQMPWTFEGHGEIFARARSVQSGQKLSELGPTQSARVFFPDILAGPALPSKNLIFRTDTADRTQLSWKAPVGTEKVRVDIFNQNGVLIESLETSESAVSTKLAQQVGTYSYQTTAIDRWNRDGYKSKMKPFHVLPPVPVVAKATPPTSPSPLKDRDPAQVTSSNLKVELPSIYRNSSYSHSRFQVEAASFGMFSTAQQNAGVSLPLAATMSLRGLHWLNSLKNDAIELSFKGKAFNYNASASEVAPLMAEARWQHRWVTDWLWASFLREMQFSSVVGVESFRNKQSALYSSGYDMLKAGFSMEFPVANNWDSGGEVLFGRAADGSTKTEVTGRFHYFLGKEWSVGAGYRVHLFEAKSEASSPAGLPYREAYGEGYSVLRYSY